MEKIKSKFTVNDVIEYLTKEEIEKLCSNIYHTLLPKISKVAAPKLIMKWDIDDTNNRVLGSYCFPCYIVIYLSLNIYYSLERINSLENDAAYQVAIELLITIIHELSHTTQDFSLIDTTDCTYTKDYSYSNIVERDNEWRSYQNCLKYADIIEEQFGITIKSLNLSAMDFSIIKDINYKSFIVNVCESYISGKYETLDEYNESKDFVNNVRNYLSDSQCLNITLTINGNIVDLMTTADNLIDKDYIEPKDLTEWLMSHKVELRYEGGMSVSKLRVGTYESGYGNYYNIDIDINMEYI